MRIVYHLGAHFTDEERLLRCLLRNRTALAEQGIEVPGPARYRALLVDTARQLRGAPAARDTQSMLLDQIVDGDEPDRIVLSWDNFLGYPQHALGDSLYPGSGKRMAAFRAVFQDLPHEFHLAMRNPATFVPAVLDKITARGKLPADLPDPRLMQWSHLVQSLRSHVPDAEITVWCDEDTPLLWPAVLRAVSGHARDTTLEDVDDLLERLMGPAGLQRMNAYLASHPPEDATHRTRIVSAFLDKFASRDVADAEIDLPGWDAALVEDLTEAYDRDITRIMRIPGVRVLVP